MGSSGLEVHSHLATPSLRNDLVSYSLHGPFTCRLIILISKGAAAGMPGRVLVLREKEFGEAAQAPERSRFNGSKGKVQVGGDL
jgi:hypothetical protein